MVKQMILIINKEKQGQIYYRLKFFKAGLDAYACTFGSAAKFTEENRVDAVILTESTEYNNVHLLCKDFKKKFPSIPLIVIAQKETSSQMDKLIAHVDNIILPRTAFSKILEIVFEYIRAFHNKDITDMILGSLRVAYYHKKIYLYGHDFKASRTEYYILRYFVNSGARPVKSEEIVKFCFNPENKVSYSNVTSFVHLINKKSTKLIGRKLISSLHDGSYEIIS